jgi:hypothetical protein
LNLWESDSAKVITAEQRVVKNITPEQWLPGMDSNHVPDRMLRTSNLLILQNHEAHQTPQREGWRTESGQNRDRQPIRKKLLESHFGGKEDRFTALGYPSKSDSECVIQAQSDSNPHFA